MREYLDAERVRLTHSTFRVSCSKCRRMMPLNTGGQKIVRHRTDKTYKTWCSNTYRIPRLKIAPCPRCHRHVSITAGGASVCHHFDPATGDWCLPSPVPFPVEPPPIKPTPLQLAQRANARERQRRELSRRCAVGAP